MEDQKTSVQPHQARSRIELEKIILGACLHENAYGRIADILTYRNFSEPNAIAGHLIDHQSIVKVFETLYPLRPIDLHTMRHAFRKTPQIAIYLAELMCMVSSTSNLLYYVFLLLEYNIRDNFAELLETSATSGGLDSTSLSAIGEIIDATLDDGTDIFDVIEMSVVHLSSVCSDESLLKSINDFRTGAQKRIEKIKARSSIDSLLNNLAALARVPHDVPTKMAVGHLTDLLKTILGAGKVSREAAHRICELRIIV